MLRLRVLFVAFVLILGADMARQAACPNIENAEIQSEQGGTAFRSETYRGDRGENVDGAAPPWLLLRAPDC
jgi:hypothetical protein